MKSNSKPETAILVQHVSKTFGHLRAVSDLSFTVRKAQSFGFLGPNGAGKTSLMRLIYGRSHIDRQKKSRCEVFGFDPRTRELEVKALCGIIPQEDNLDSQLNVLQNLRVYSRFYDLPSRVAENRIAELLEFMELTEKKTVKIKNLSGGMKRRLIIVRALMHKPRLLILDEPTTGLDPQVRHLIWKKLRELKSQGMTILLTTHYMEEAFQVCDRILIMDKGRRILEGRPQTLLNENIEQYVLETVNSEFAEHAEKRSRNGNFRSETSREPIQVFSDDADALKTLADELDEVEYQIRRTNLEDLFLKTTGKKLNEWQ